MSICLFLLFFVYEFKIEVGGLKGVEGFWIGKGHWIRKHLLGRCQGVVQTAEQLSLELKI